MKFLLLTLSLVLLQGTLTFEIPENSEGIYSNKLNQLYVAKGSELFLYSEKGEHLYSFNDISLGEISVVDVNLSLKPLLFYKDIQAIVFLDNTLSQQGGTIYTVNHEFSNVTYACHSVDNNFWVFERDNFELIRINRQMQVISRSGNLSLLLGRTIQADQMLEKDNLLYVRDAKKGIYVFDIYGNWVKTIPLNIEAKIEVHNNMIYFADKGKLYKYVQKDFLEYELELGDGQVKDFSFQSNTLFTLNGNTVTLHSNPDE